MKICHLINSYPLSTGGMQTYCYTLCNRLAINKNDITLLVSGIIDDSLAFNSDFKVIKSKPWFSIGKATFSPSLLLNLLRYKFDIIHVHLPFHFGFEIALFVAKVKNIPLIVTYHCEAIDYKNSFVKSIVMNAYNKLNNLLLKYADHIIFTTDDYANQFNFSKSKLSIIPIGVDTNRFKVRNRNVSRKSIGLPHDKYIVLFVGNLDVHNYYKKGVEYLLKAVPLIRNEIPNIYINLVGKTSNETKDIINGICKNNNITDNVHVTGYTSEDELPLHYSSSNVLILPSVSKLEAFGIVLLEALASGLPIIGSNIPGVRSVVKSSKVGFLVEPKSSQDIASTIINIYKINTFEHFALETIRNKYDWDKIVVRINTIYKNLTNK